jgi:general stress protein 26
MDDGEFWNKVYAAARKANRAYLATVEGGQPRVRVVFPAFEGRRLWIATRPDSAKARQLRRDPRVELFYEIGAKRPTVHLTITGVARFVDDPAEKARIWNAKLFGYNLGEFWLEGPESKDFGLLLITAQRVELGTQPEMWQGQRTEVWKPQPPRVEKHRG